MGEFEIQDEAHLEDAQRRERPILSRASLTRRTMLVVG